MTRKEYLTNWRRNNKDKCKAYTQKWLIANPGRDRQCIKEFRERRKIFIENLKDKPGLDCGIKYPSPVMEFDHRDPELKVMSIAEMRSWGVSKQTLLDEVAKCDLVCANCHRLRTWKNK